MGYLVVGAKTAGSLEDHRIIHIFFVALTDQLAISLLSLVFMTQKLVQVFGKFL